MNVTTATGKSFKCDFSVPGLNPPRLYLHIVDASLHEVAVAFTKTVELPLQDYPDYTEFDSMNVTPDGGVNICLK